MGGDSYGPKKQCIIDGVHTGISPGCFAAPDDVIGCRGECDVTRQGMGRRDGEDSEHMPPGHGTGHFPITRPLEITIADTCPLVRVMF